MPIFRKRRRKRTMRAKSSLTRRVTKITKRISSLIEKKHKDLSSNGNFASDQTANSLTAMIQGDASNQRTGLKITAKNVYVKLLVQWVAGVTSSLGSCRYILFMDRNSQGATPSGTDLLESQSVQSLLNNINEGRRFIVLADKLFNNPQPSTAVGYDKSVAFKIPLNKNVWYLDSSDNQSSLGRNQIYQICVGDNTIASGNAPAFSSETRVYYEDL